MAVGLTGFSSVLDGKKRLKKHQKIVSTPKVMLLKDFFFFLNELSSQGNGRGQPQYLCGSRNMVRHTELLCFVYNSLCPAKERSAPVCSQQRQALSWTFFISTIAVGSVPVQGLLCSDPGASLWCVSVKCCRDTAILPKFKQLVKCLLPFCYEYSFALNIFLKTSVTSVIHTCL